MVPAASQPFVPDHAIAVGLYLARYRWDHALVLTSREPRSTWSFRRQFTERMVPALERLVGQSVAFFWAVEGRGTEDSRHHLHALIAGTADLPVTAVRSAWRAGTTDVKRYDYRRDAARYVAKGILASPDAYDFSLTLPPELDAKAVFNDQQFLAMVRRFQTRHDPV